MNGFDSRKCAKRNRVAAQKHGIDSAPVRFLKSAPSASDASVWSRGTLPQTPADALTRINASLPGGATPLTEDQVYIHYLEAANGNYVGDRSAFLSPSTLKNIATNADAGFAFMNSHRTGGMSHPTELPFGRTFAGRYEQTTNADGTTSRRALVGFYMLRGQKPNGDSGPSTDALHDGIDAGTIFDVSVGLRGGQALCDVCGNDIREYDYDTYSYTCPHVPGSTQEMTEEQQAAQTARGVPGGVASYTIYEAYCGEVSAVYDGAVPGAGFKKALALVRQGALTRQELSRIPAYSALLGKGDSDMDMDDIEDRITNAVRTAVGGLNPFSRRGGDDGGNRPAGDNPAPQHPVLVAALAAGVTSPEEFTALKKKADEQPALKVKADAYDAQIAKQRDAAKGLLVVLHPKPEDLAAEQAIVDSLPAGTALDRYCQKIEEQHDAHLGTSKNGNAARHTVPPVASPASISAELSTEEATKVQKEAADSITASFGPKKN